MTDALVIGGGPAGLMAAEMLADAGHSVLVAEAKPTMGRKLLMAGKSGLNLTKNEEYEPFMAAYGTARGWLEPMLADFNPSDVQDWAEGLEQKVFTGSSGRVFPETMKASPLLRAWIGRLAGKGVRFETRWRWRGFDESSALFDTPRGVQKIKAQTTVLALGGASWSRLGSDGAWASILADKAVELSPFKPANMGFLVPWSSHMAPYFGSPVKPVRLSFGKHSVYGEFVVSRKGVEGGAIYHLAAALRDGMDKDGAEMRIDLLPDLPMPLLAEKLRQTRGKKSLGTFLRKTVGISGVKAALFNENEQARRVDNPFDLAGMLKALPLRLAAPRPLDEAISTAGGVTRAALTDGLMLKNLPGVFCAGEMLDWEAPTGGYLLTACLATGRVAGKAAAAFMAKAS
ncbi:MAG: TIGR03862 family flavoprotein [Rhodobacteraceae bacterium]|nr:TIGR03862 family flavoprotein [Paracoccaceae bacterium]